MKKFKFIVLSAVLLALTILGAAACAQPTMHKVSFDAQNGAEVTVETVEEGKTVARPDDPVRGIDRFKGWFTAADGGEAYVFSKPVKADLTLYARYDEYRTVTFVYGYKTETTEVKKGDTVEKPLPSQSGKVFIDWFDGDSPFDFNTPIVSDLTLTAKWAEETVTQGLLTFTVSSDKSGYAVTAKQGEKLSGKLEIPTQVNSLPVTSLPSGAFMGQTGLTEAVIPASVKAVGINAFRGCENITRLDLPFAGTSPDGEGRLGDIFGVGFDDSGAVLSEVRRDGADIYEGKMPMLEYLAIRGGESVARGVLSGQSKLTELVLPFVGTSLYYDENPGSVCGALFGGVLYEGSYKISQPYGLAGGVDQYSTAYIPETLSKVTILAGNILNGDTVSRLPFGAFNRMTSLEEVVLAEGLGALDSLSLNFVKLSRLVIPASVTYIGDEAIGYNNFETVLLPDGLEHLGVNTFAQCTELKSVNIPAKITALPDYMFYGCTALKSFEIPSQVTKIGNNAFGSCTALSELVLPDSLTEIDDNAFNNCRLLSAVKLPAGLKTLGKRAFRACSALVSITLPAGLTAVPESAFESCSGLGSVSFEGNIISIGIKAFYMNAKLLQIAMPSSLQSIGDEAFNLCEMLQTIRFSGNEPPTIGAKTFNAEYNAALIVPAGRADVYRGAFTALADYVYSMDQLAQDTDLIVEDNTVIRYIGSYADTVVIPAGITAIAPRAFYNSGLLIDKVVLPDSVTTVGEGAFAVKDKNFECRLSEIVLSEGLTAIPQNFAYNLGSLKKIVIPSSVVSIGKYAFSYCWSLNYIEFEGAPPTLDDDIKYMSTMIFPLSSRDYSNTSLTGRNFITFVVPDGKLGDYIEAMPNYVKYSQFNNESYTVYNTVCRFHEKSEIVDGKYIIDRESQILLRYLGEEKDVVIPGNIGGVDIIGIGDKAFYFNMAMESLSIPDGIRSLGYKAFMGCGALKSVDLNKISYLVVASSGQFNADLNHGYHFAFCTALESVDFGNITYIARHMFDGCGSLKTVDLEGMRYVDGWAFQNCSSLTELYLPGSLTGTATNDWEAVGGASFFGCSSLTKIIFGVKGSPDHDTRINAFGSKSPLVTTVIIEDCQRVFYEASMFRNFNMENIFIPRGAYLDVSTFNVENDRALKNIYLEYTEAQLAEAIAGGLWHKDWNRSTVAVVHYGVTRPTGL